MPSCPRLAPSLFLLSTLAACGGSTTGSPPGGSATASGTIAGTPLTVASEVAILGYSSESGACTINVADGGENCPPNFVSNEVTVVLTDHADVTCSEIQSLTASNSSIAFASLATLALTVNVVNGAIVAGTYAIGSGNPDVTGAAAGFSTTTATCATAQTIEATAGTVTLSAASATRVTGTYSVTFGTQGSASGSFDVPICGIDAGTAATKPTQVCTP